MSKISNYLKENQNEIAVAMMSANAMMSSTAPDWKLMEELRGRN